MDGTKMTNIATTLVFWKDDDRIPACIHGDLQKAAIEIERLEGDANSLCNTITSIQLSLKERDAEIERLRTVVDAALKQDNPCDELIEAIAALEDKDD